MRSWGDMSEKGRTLRVEHKGGRQESLQREGGTKLKSGGRARMVHHHRGMCVLTITCRLVTFYTFITPLLSPNVFLLQRLVEF